MRSIYWQAMLKVKKKSDKQRQRLDKIRERDERATDEKEKRYKQNICWKIEHTKCRCTCSEQ